jgi:hypothetical protein
MPVTAPPSAATFAIRPPTLTRAQGLDLGFIFLHYGEAYRAKNRMPLHHWKAMIAIESCRTARLGGHVQECGDCGEEQISYNSCRNRHCPKCQHLDTNRWLQQQSQDLLPIPYYHVVFTLPEELRSIALFNKKVVYNILFQAAAETLQQLSPQPQHLGAQLGFIAVLHTWTQQMLEHPHLHCIVTGGGLSPDGKRWVNAPANYLLPVEVVSPVFAGKFLEALQQAYDADKLKPSGARCPVNHPTTFKNLRSKLSHMFWNIDIRPSFDNPRHVIDYLARYTHRVAITNDRLVELENDQVTFRWKDRRDGNQEKLMTLHVEEFMRRFMLHILPEGFIKIRHYGLLSNRQRRQQLALCRKLLKATPPPETAPLTTQELYHQLTGIDPTRCRACGEGRLLYRAELPPLWKRGPPPRA